MITRLLLKNFRQYRGTHEVVFQPGLNLIQGSNDAGKSTLFHAICFALFNYTPVLGAATQPLITQGELFTEVIVEFTALATGELYRLTRRREGGRRGSTQFSLEKRVGDHWETVVSTAKGSKEIDLRRELLGILKFDKRAFLNAVYSQQKEFVRLVRGGVEVKKEIDALLGMTIASNAALCFKELSKEVDEKIAKEESLRKLLDEQVKTRNTYIDSIRRQAQEIMEVRSKLAEAGLKLASVKKVHDEILTVKRSIDGLKAAITQMEKAFLRLQQAKEGLEGFIEEYGSKESLLTLLKSEQDRFHATEEELKRVEGEISRLRSALDGFRKSLGYVEQTLKERLDVSSKTTCPKCGQPVDPLIVRAEVEKLEKQWKDLKNELDKGLEEERKLEAKRRSLVEAKQAISERLSSLRRDVENIEKLEGEVKRYQVEFEALKAGLEDRVKEVEEVRAKASFKLMNYKPQIASPLLKAPPRDVDLLESAYKRIEEEVIREKGVWEERLNSSRRSLESKLNEQRSNIKLLKDLLGRIKETQAELAKIGRYKVAKEGFMRIQLAYRELEEALKSQLLNLLAIKTYFWYTRLVGEAKYVGLRINPESYELEVQPLGFPEPQPVKSFSGGGIETVFALAMRFALAEILGLRDFLLFDEPTDAADTKNRDAIVNVMHEASQFFNQILLITHHGVGVEVAAHVINVSYDSARKSSLIEVEA